jgi:protein-L-isoaspartate(D-aspartate) O-methyltransferase
MDMQNTQAKNMVLGQILTNDVLDPRILRAMTETPRGEFVPASLKGAAYVDEELDVGNGRALMEPMTFARLLHMAEIAPECRVLTIGCLSGYSAVVLSKLASHVVAVDIDETLIAEARAHVERLKISSINIQQVKSLADGYAASAPYDVIVICGAIQFIPEQLGTQLAKGGRLVAIRNVAARIGVKGGLGKGLLIRRIHNQLQSREYFDAGTPLLPGFENKSGFRF